MADPNGPAKDPPPQIIGLDDSRKYRDGGNNEFLKRTEIHKTRSGHTIEYDDNEGNEHITIQHRSGSTLQFQADGSIRFRSNNGKMGFEILGEGYVQVTGAYTIDVKGGASMRVTNDLTVKAKNIHMTADESFTTTAKNIISTAEDKNTTKGKYTRVEGGSELNMAGGASTLTGEGSLKLKADRIDLNPSGSLGTERF